MTLLQQMFNKINDTAKLFGMKIYADETKVMLIAMGKKCYIERKHIEQVHSPIWGEINTENALCETEQIRGRSR